MYKFIIMILLISSTSYADPTQNDSIYITKGQTATFSGFLVPEATIKALRNDSLELDLYKTTSGLKDQQIALLGAQNTNLSNTLEKTSSLSTWEKVGYFTAGVLLTALAVDGASKIITH
jgi:hypothetical protein